MVQALYIDPRGPYPALLGVENCWDEKRDARLYDGPEPVVAHPPCGPFGCLKHLYKGNAHDCAPRAVEQVRRFGGVLEHPAKSSLFDRMRPGYPPWPGDLPDPWGGFTVEVDQVEWGHVARKRTWLYVVGVPRAKVSSLGAMAPFPGRQPTHWVSGFRNEGKGAHPKRGQACPPGIKICSAQQRRRTPPAFAELLIEIARSVRPASSGH